MHARTISNHARTLITAVLVVLLTAVPSVVFAGGQVEEEAVEELDDQQAPALAELVAAGELPPLEERLPVNPKVIEPREEIGTYGGQGRSALIGAADGGWLARSIAIDGLVHWDTSWSEIVPAAAASYDISDDATTYTFELREGLRWHDGEPFTTADIEWWYENEALNEELSPSPPAIISVGDQVADLEIIDEQTFSFVFPEPNALFLDDMSNPTIWIPTARHYGEQLHADFNDDVHDIAAAEGFDDWVDYYDYMIMDGDANWRNPDLPSIRAWTPAPGEGYTGDVTRVRFVRNPYYYRVDTEGNQLPYIDEWVFDILEDREVLLLQTLAGEIDIMARHIMSVDNRPVLTDNVDRGDYRIFELQATGAAASVIKLNMTHDDDNYRELVGNRDFRVGLSYAMDREEIIDILWAGLPIPRQPAPQEEMPWFNEQLAYQYTEHDPELAREYFESAGLEYDDDGVLLGFDGEPVELEISVMAERDIAVQMLEIIQQQWRDAGVEMTIDSVDRTLFYERKDSNLHRGAVDGGAGGARDALVDPRYYFPYSNESNFAPRWAAWYGDDTVLAAGVEPEEPPKAAQRQMELYDQLLASPPDRHAEIMSEIMEIAAEEFWVMAPAGPTPNYGVMSNRIVNGFPDEGALHGWPLGDIGVYHWSEWFIRE